MATIMMVVAVIVAAVTVASFIGALVAAAIWAVSACNLIEANFDLFSVGILIGGRDHLTNPFGGLRLNLERRSW